MNQAIRVRLLRMCETSAHIVTVKNWIGYINLFVLLNFRGELKEANRVRLLCMYDISVLVVSP